MRITPSSLCRYTVNKIRRLSSFFVYSDSFIIFKATSQPASKIPSTRLHKITSHEEIRDIYIDLERNYSSLDQIIASRLKHGYTFFTLSDGDRIVYTTWMTDTNPRFIDEIAITIHFEKNNIWIRDSFCIEELRGNRYFSKVTALIIDEYFPQTTHLYSDTVVSNTSSVSAHKKYGFKLQFKIHYIIFFKRLLIRRKETNDLNIKTYRDGKLVVPINQEFKQYVADNLA